MSTLLDRAIGIPFKLITFAQKAYTEGFWWLKRKRQKLASWVYNKVK